MKKQIAIIVSLAFFVALVLWLLLIPVPAGTLGTLNVSPGTTQTNAAGGVELVSNVSNAGPNALRVWVGIQSKQAGGWVAVTSNNRTYPVLAPGTEVIITNAFPKPVGSWRVFATGQRVYPYTRLGTVRQLFDMYVLRKEVHRYFYSIEMQ